MGLSFVFSVLLVTLFVCALNNVSAQQQLPIAFGISTQLTEPAVFIPFTVGLIEGYAVAFNKSNAKYAAAGGPCYRNISIFARDDLSNVTLELQHINYFISQPNFVGLIGISTGPMDVIINITAAANMSFIGSNNGGEILYHPPRPHVLNTVPNHADEAAAQIHFLTNKFIFTRISLIYGDGSLSLSSPFAQAVLRLLSELGLHAVSADAVPTTNLGDYNYTEYRRAVQNIKDLEPQAIMIAGFANVLGNVMLAAAEIGVFLNDPKYTVIVDSNCAVTINAFGPFFAIYPPPTNFYVTSPLPVLNDLSGPLPIVQSYFADRALYGQGLIFPPIELVSIGGYMTGRLITSILDSLGPDRNTVTRETFLSALYASPVINTTDGLYFNFQGGCNVGNRQFYVSELVFNASNAILPFMYRRLDQWTYTWHDTCSAIRDDVRTPFVLGGLSTTTDFAVAVRAAFTESNDAGAFDVFGRRTYLISSRRPTQSVADATAAMLNDPSILALVGYTSNEVALSTITAGREGGSFFAPRSGKPFFRSNPNFVYGAADFAPIVNMRAGWFDEISTAATYYVGSLNYTRFGVFADKSTDADGLIDKLDKALAIYRRIASVKRTSATGEPLPSPRRVWEARYSSSDSLNLPDNTRSTSVDVVIVFCQDNEDVCVEFLSLLVTQNPFRELLAVHLIWACDTAVLLEKAQRQFGLFSANSAPPPFAITLASSYPSPWQPSTNGSSDTMAAEYARALSNVDTDSGQPVSPSLESFEGFIAGRFLLAVLSSTRNNGTRETLLSAVYERSVFPLARDFRLGPYSDACLSATATAGQPGVECCNQGAHVMYILSLKPLPGGANGSFWEPTAEYPFVTCSFPLPEEPSADGDSSSSDNTSLIVGLVVGVGVGVSGLAAAGVLVVLYVRRAKHPQRRKLKEPNYRQLALAGGSELLEKARVEPLFFSVLPPMVSDREIRDRIAEFDELLAGDVDMARYVVHVLSGGHGTDPVEPTELAHALCYIYHAHRKGADLLVAFAQDEIRIAMEVAARRHGAATGSAPTVLFRQDNFMSKLFKVYSRLVGLPFLWQALANDMYDIEEASHLNANTRLGKTRRRRRPSRRRGSSGSSDSANTTSGTTSDGTSNEDSDSNSNSTSNSSGSQSMAAVTVEEFSLEIDPKRAKRGDDPIANSLQLRLVVHRIVQSLQDVSNEFPTELRTFLLGLRWALEEHGEAARGMINPSTAAFVFLRFICPAITSPHTHGLFREPPNAPAQRFLVLLSKVVMNLALGIMFEKEDYMISINDYIMQNNAAVKGFLDSLSISTFKPVPSSHTDRVEQQMTEDDDEQTVHIKTGLKHNALKLLYYYLATHQAAITPELPPGLDRSKDASKWPEFIQKLSSLGLIEQDARKSVLIAASTSSPPAGPASPATASSSTPAIPSSTEDSTAAEVK